jgi:hypothetical protein
MVCVYPVYEEKQNYGEMQRVNYGEISPPD